MDVNDLNTIRNAFAAMWRSSTMNGVSMGLVVDICDRYVELEADNARLRQQRDAASAQLDFILEKVKCDTPPGPNVSSQD